MAAKKTPENKTDAAADKKQDAEAGNAPADRPRKAPAASKALVRRPDTNRPPDTDFVEEITDEILYLIDRVDDYAANLRALDRQRHNSVGLKRQGFIDAAYRLSTSFPQYFPHWLTTAKFKRDISLFNAIRTLIDACRSLEEKAWNINVEASDMAYTDALEYYSQVQDAARRRIDSAESIYNELNTFFRHGSRSGEEPTKKQIKRDVNALLDGRKDGEIVIKNVRPKLTGGKHEVIDETFKGSASYKETDEADIKEKLSPICPVLPVVSRKGQQNSPYYPIAIPKGIAKTHESVSF